MQWQLYLIFSVLILVLLVIVVCILRSQQTSQTQNQTLLTEVLQRHLKINQDLMNRIMSQDLQTYQTMTASNNSLETTALTSEGLIYTDEAELMRLQQLAGAQGTGDAIFDDTTEFQEMLGEFGLHRNDNG